MSDPPVQGVGRGLLDQRQAFSVMVEPPKPDWNQLKVQGTFSDTLNSVFSLAVSHDGPSSVCHRSRIDTPEINQFLISFDWLLRGTQTDARGRAHTQVVAPPPPLCRFHTGCSFSSGSGSLQRTLPASQPGLAPPPAGCS